MALQRFLNQRTFRLIFNKNLGIKSTRVIRHQLFSDNHSKRFIFSISSSSTKVRQSKTQFYRSNKKSSLSSNQQVRTIDHHSKFNQDILNTDKLIEMSSTESEAELTNEQIQKLFDQRPAYLLIRKYDDQETVYLRLLYKYKVFEDEKQKNKEKLFSFQRKFDEPFYLFVDRMKLHVAKYIMQSRGGRKKKQEIDGTNINNQNLMDVEIFYKDDLLSQNITLSQILKLNEQDLRLVINGVYYQVYFNPQFIASCKLPKVVLSNFEIFPIVHIDFQSSTKPLFGWYKKINKNHPLYEKFKKDGKLGKGILKLSNQLTYTPTDDDIGCELIFRATSRLSEDQLLESYEVVSRKVIKSPDYFPFEQRHKLTRNQTNIDELRVVSYNILADMYSDSKTARCELFKHCPPQYLTMDYRKHLILKELIGYNADLICLQEVDFNVFEKHLQPALKIKTNLTGLISLKIDMQEGCAIFYNQDKFNLIEKTEPRISDLIKKDQFEILESDIKKNFQLNARFTVRPNILQVVALECKHDKDRVLLIFNTHFYFHPDSDHIRLLQACLILKEVEDMVDKYSKLYKSVTPIIAGDFNSCPEFGVYKLFTQGKVNKNIRDWKSCQSEFIENFSFESRFKFVSAYGRPVYTNYTELFFGCLDYIFVDPNQCKIEEIVPLIPHEEVIANKALPCKNIPSDHIALVCTLKFV